MKSRRFLVSLLVIAGLFSPRAIHADPSEFLRKHLGSFADSGRVVIEGTDQESAWTMPNNAYTKGEVVAVDGPLFSTALRVKVTERVDPVYKAVLHSTMTRGTIKQGDQLVVVFAVRCLQTGNETGTSWSQVWLSDDSANAHQRAFEVYVGRNWEVRIHKMTATKNFEEGKSKLAFHLGRYEQVLEVGPLFVLAYPPDADLQKVPIFRYTYDGREPNAPWRALAQERIEKFRKGDLRIDVSNARGPVAGASVQVRMKRHAYEFGTYLEFPALWNEADGPKKASDGEKYRQNVQELFNRVTCPLYWSDSWGYYNPERRKTYLGLAEWAQKNGFAVRGHTLVYPGHRYMPKSILGLTNDVSAMRKAIEESIAERMAVGKQFGFTDYDVVNEMRHNQFPMNLLGWDVVPRWFNQCKAIHPEGLMGINENTILASYGDNKDEREIYRRQIDAILAGGAKVEVIGFQGHFGATPTPPEVVYQRIEEFVKYKVPLHVTEFDINTDDEELQGDYMRDFLTLFFSHPSTTAFTQWGFWEGQHWIPRAALFRKDWSLKPNGKAFKDLVLKEWWTRGEMKTDKSGTGFLRGFLGDYEAVVSAGGKTKVVELKLTRGGTTVPVVMD